MKLAVLALCAPLAGCVSFRWDRVTEEQPPPPHEVSRLVIGEDSVTTCLQRLGAPTHVWPRDAGEMVLAYAWASAAQWGFRVSAALRGTSAPVFDFDNLGANTVGYALWFDRDWKLSAVHFGHLEELANGASHSKSNVRFEDNGATDAQR